MRWNGKSWCNGGVACDGVAAEVATATTPTTLCMMEARMMRRWAGWLWKHGEERGYGGGAAAERAARMRSCW